MTPAKLRAALVAPRPAGVAEASDPHTSVNLSLPHSLAAWLRARSGEERRSASAIVSHLIAAYREIVAAEAQEE